MFRSRTFSSLSQEATPLQSPRMTDNHGRSTGVGRDVMESLAEIHGQAARYADEFGFTRDTDGLQDAFRHAYTASRFANSVGGPITDALGIAYEVLGYPKAAYLDGFGHSTAASAMDINNNRVGESIGENTPLDDDAALRIYLDVIAGRLEVVDTIEHENGEKEYRRRQTDFRDVEHRILEPKFDPIDFDNPDDGFDGDWDWDPDTAIA